MQITLCSEGSRLTAFLSGELDQFSAERARDELDTALSDGRITRIEFDLGGVTFMDSSGIGVILGRYRRMMERGGSMSVMNAKGGVERLLRLSGVYTLCTERSSK